MLKRRERAELRLAKYLAAAGVASRRKSEQIIAMGLSLIHI